MRPQWTGLKLVDPPDVEPVTLDEAKLHLRIDGVTEDTLVSRYIKAARERAEAHTGRALITQKWDVYFDRFPESGKPLSLPRSPVAAVDWIKYLDANGAEQTWNAALYQLDLKREPETVSPKAGESYPTTQAVPSAVNIRITCGYGAAGADVPEPIVDFIRLATGHLYANREPVVTGTIATELPSPLAGELDNYRVWWF